MIIAWRWGADSPVITREMVYADSSLPVKVYRETLSSRVNRILTRAYAAEMANQKPSRPLD